MLDNIIAELYCEIHTTCKGCIYEKTRDNCSCTELVPDDLIQECIDILMMIKNTDEKSATKCFETINQIKEKYNADSN